MNIEPDGTNENKDSGSTYPDNLIKKVKEEKADIGIALDGDADRCILVDENGNLINGDKILAIIATHWKENDTLDNNTVVGTIMTNKALENYLLENNIKLIRTKVGDRNIIKEMKSKEFIIGGEPSGHIILNNHSSTGDGILASLEVLGIMKTKKRKLSKLSNIYRPFPQIIENYPLKKNQDLERLINKVEKKIKRLLNYNQARLIIRKSGTENKIRIMSEANNIETTKYNVQETLKIIKEFI